jgi:hypothetical protein
MENEKQQVFVCFVDGKPRGLLRGEKMFLETRPYWDYVRTMLVPMDKKDDLTIHNCLNYLTLFETKFY